MSYTALYRKWRPKTFADVKGQDPIVKTLENQIKTGKVGHAYLFCGSRGTGKTTIAKIFAKAVNCEHPVDGEPCGECEICKAIDAGNSLNVVELDAASHNGVDDIRELLEDVSYPPTSGKYRVYILDEAHMITTNGANAFLKTLEEPPKHVIFILATTEPHKLPATILSRCQEYDFRRISTDDIVERLKQLCEGEGIKIEERALKYIARKADGGLRDAISLLDRADGASNGELTYDDVLTFLGAVKNDIFSRFTRLTIEKNATALLELIDEIVMSGREISQFTQDLIWYFRNLLLVKASSADAAMIDVSDDDRARLSKEAEQIGEEEIIELIKLYSACYNDMRQSISKRVIFEVAAIKSIRTNTASGPMTEQPKKVEPVKFAEPVKKAAPAPVAKEAPVPAKQAPAPVPTPVAKTKQVASESGIDVFKKWDKVVASLSAIDKAMASKAKPVIEGNELALYYEDQIECDGAKRFEVVDKTKTKVAEIFGENIKAVIKFGAAPGDEVLSNEDAVKKVFGGIDIEIEGE